MNASVERVSVVGGRTVGAGIAEVSARAGLHVLLVEVDREAARRGRERIERSIAEAVERGKLDSADATTAPARGHRR